jgi:molybdenum cofactor cytidylyltransferase
LYKRVFVRYYKVKLLRIENMKKYFPDKVYAILMASGFSKRFGKPNKLLSPFRGKALARHTLDLVCGLNCFSRIVFVAAEKAVFALAGDLPVRAVCNEHPERGPRESIRLGLEAALVENETPGETPRRPPHPTGPVSGGGPSGSRPDYYMFFPCDQPLLDAATVRRIVDARRPGHIVQPCCRGEPGNPVLFSAAFRKELLTLGDGEQGLDLIRRHSDCLIQVEIADPALSPSPLTDIDDPRTLALLEGDG